jgi:hypothetical protein
MTTDILMRIMFASTFSGVIFFLVSLAISEMLTRKFDLPEATDFVIVFTGIAVYVLIVFIPSLMLGGILAMQ